MKKYLGILLVMIGIILIPGNVNAGLEMIMGQGEYQCTTEQQTQKYITTCPVVYRNSGDSDFNGGTLELTFTPDYESTTVTFVTNEVNAQLVSSIGNVYTLNVEPISAGETLVVGNVTWTANSSVSNIGGIVSTNWKGETTNPDTDIEDIPVTDDNGTITDDYGSSSSDMFVNSYTQEKTYNVTITWGCLEYDYVEKLDGTSEWKAAAFSDGQGENYVLVENYSNVAMSADISFESSIEGVEANYITDYSYYENDEEHVKSGTESYITLAPYVENENNHHAAVQWIVNLTGGTYDAVENAYNNGERKIGTITILVGDATMGDVG